MAEITADLVKRLRETTGAGMMDCKKALGETGGDFDAAVDWLRKKGLAAAHKKAGRVAAEGLVAVVVEGGRGADRRGQFRDRLRRPQRQVPGASSAPSPSWRLRARTSQDLTAKPMPGEGKTVADKLTDLIATIGENMSLRRMATLSAGNRRRGVLCPQRPGPGPRQDRRPRRAGVDGRQGEAGRPRQADRHACGGGQPAGAEHRCRRPGGRSSASGRC